MNVWRLWRALTWMVLCGRGGYEVNLVLDDGGQHGEHDGPGRAVSGLTNWVLTRLNWVGGKDRFAVLAGEPDDFDGYRREVAVGVAGSSPSDQPPAEVSG